jgi:hypothetical protein
MQAKASDNATFPELPSWWHRRNIDKPDRSSDLDRSDGCPETSNSALKLDASEPFIGCIKIEFRDLPPIKWIGRHIHILDRPFDELGFHSRIDDDNRQSHPSG